MKLDSQTKVNQCANEILENTPFIAPGLDVLLTDESAAVAEYLSNKALWNDDDNQIHLTVRDKTENLITKYKDRFFEYVKSAFLILGTIYGLYMIYCTQFTGEFLGKKKHDFVYLAIKFLIVFYLLGLGKIFPLVFGVFISSWLLLISLAVWFSNTFLAATEIDTGFETTQAEAMASSQFSSMFQSEVENSAALWLLESKSFATHEFGKTEGFKRFLVPSKFTECMKQPAPASRFVATTVLNGYVQKSKDCFDEVGDYKLLDFGSFNYYGNDDAVKAKLLEIVDYAHTVAFDTIRLMCNKALNVDNRRENWSSQANSNPVAYEQCINRNFNGEVITGENGEIQFFDKNDGVTPESINATIAQARQVYISAATAFVENKTKAATQIAKTNAIDSNVGSFIIGMNMIRDVSSSLDKAIYDEFNVNVSVKQSNQLSGRNDEKAGLEGMDDVTKMGASLAAMNTQKVFDVNRTIEALMNGSQKEVADRRIKNTVESISNALLGDYYKISGFTFEDCTKAINTCTAPMLNQSAALFQSGLKMLQAYWAIYAVGQVVKNFYKDGETQRSQMIARNAGSANFVTGLAMAACGTLLLIGGVLFPMLFICRLGSIVPGLASFLIIIVYKILLLILPNNSNLDHQRSNEKLMDSGLSLVWKLLEPSLIFIVGMFAVAIHALISTTVGLVVWAICTPLMMHTSPIATLCGVFFTAIIFQFVSVKIQWEIAKSLLNGLDAFEKDFKVETIVKHTQNAMSTYQEAADKFNSLTNKLMRS
ncbi:hypothetical protein [Pseudomonas coronafaciens]|uniref:hypothetical protein n=1 Tax=Pseudomonas coronafaciens TaxID=53409 RepID=UPI0037B61619